VALRAEGATIGYPELAQLLRRRAPVQDGIAKVQMRELFRRMVFNILMDNTDDHEKNHVLLMDDAQHLVLAPAFDVLPAAQGLGYQQMRIGRDGADSTIKNACSEAALFGLSAAEAGVEAAAVATACGQWRSNFGEAGVARADLEYLAQFIDRDFLRQQREGLIETVARRATAPRKRKSKR
jgi:serine/threonine-protein kinase HipA